MGKPTVLLPAPASNLQKVEMEIREQKRPCISVSMQETKLEGDSCFSPSPIAEAEITCDSILSEKTGNICHSLCLAAAVSGPLGWKHSPPLTNAIYRIHRRRLPGRAAVRQRSGRVASLDDAAQPQGRSIFAVA